MTVGVAFATQPMFVIATAVLVVMAIGALVRLADRMPASNFEILAVVVGIPVLTFLNRFGYVSWDDTAHWIPNALYLYVNNDVPRDLIAPLHSGHPGYPYAMAMFTYLASTLAGGFLAQGDAMLGILGCIALAAILLEFSPVGQLQDEPFVTRLAVGLSAFVFITILNPAFHSSFSSVGMAEASTSITLAAIGLVLLRIIGRDPTAPLDTSRAKRADWHLMLQSTALALLFVQIKQVNIYVLLLIMGGTVIALLRAGQWNRKYLFLPLALLAPLFVRFIWNHYVEMHIGGNDFQAQPFSAWRLDLMAPLLLAMGEDAFKHPGLFLGFAVVLAAAVSIFRRGLKSSLDCLVVATAVTIVGYQCFLLAAYVGSNFTEIEISRAASYYRYSTHIGYLTWAICWLALPWIFSQARRWRSIAFMDRPLLPILRSAGPVILAIVFIIRPSLLVPAPRPVVCFNRTLAGQVAKALPPGSNLLIANHFSNSGLYLSFQNLAFGFEEARSGRFHGAIAVAPDDRPLQLDDVAPDIRSVLFVPAPVLVAERFHGRNGEPALLVTREAGGDWRRHALTLPLEFDGIAGR